MKNYSIQSLKGICALIVFFSHALNFPNIPVVQSLMHSPIHVFFDGQIAVIVFIVISGFFYQKSLKFSFGSYWIGIKKKIFRIWIPYVLVILLGALVCNAVYNIDYEKSLFTDWATSFWTNKVQLSDVLTHFAVILPHDTHLIDPPSWYVPVEVRLFLIVPIIVMIANTNKYTKIIYIPFIVLMILGKSIYIGACIFGCISRILYNKYYHIIENTKYLSLLQILGLIIAIIFLNINNEVALNKNMAFTMQVVGAVILVPIIYSQKMTIMTNKFFAWFGDISYEFYLIHFIILLAIRPLIYDSITYIISTYILSVFASISIKKCSDFIVSKINSINYSGVKVNS